MHIAHMVMRASSSYLIYYEAYSATHDRQELFFAVMAYNIEYCISITT